MGRKKGDSFITQPPFEVLIALVFAFLLIGFMIAQSGGINSILNSLCEKVPDLCKGSVSTVDYQIAKQSTDSLACAINTVLTGKQQCTQVKIGSITAQAVAAGGVTGAQTAAQAQAGSASITCDIKNGYPEIEYEESCTKIYVPVEVPTANPPYIATCPTENVWYVLDKDGQWKWKSDELAMDENNNQYYNYMPLSNMNGVLNKLDKVHVEIKNNLDNINNIPSIQADERFRKGMAEAFAKVMGYNDNRYGNDDRIIVHHKDGKTETLGRSTEDLEKIKNLGIENIAACKISNFNLPEDFAGLTGKAEEFINGLGDPSFLVYYQSFPVGEDADWESQSEWFTGIGKAMFITMCVADIARPIFKAVPIAKNAIKSASEKIAARLSLRGVSRSVDEAAVAEAERLMPELATKVEGKTIVEFMRTDNINKGIVDYFRAKYFSKGVDAAFDEAVKPLGEISMEQSVRLKEGFRKIWNGGTTSTDLTQMLANKAEPGLMEKLIGQRAKTPETWMRYAKYIGVDYGVSYVAAILDRGLSKTIVTNPNSLSLNSPMKGIEPNQLSKNTIDVPQKIDYPDKQNLMPIGKPVVLIKKEWGNQPTPFYLASPCMADLIIESKPMSCGIYTYNSQTNLASCENPDKDVYKDWYNSLVNGERLPTCGSLVGADYPIFDKFKVSAQSIVENMRNAESPAETDTDSGKRIKIHDPIENIDFFYDQNNKMIDAIGANYKKSDNSYSYGLGYVKDFLENLNKGGDRSSCFGIDKDRCLFIDSVWDKAADPSYWSTPYIKTTNDGSKGFICKERKIGELPVTQDQKKGEGKVEKFMVGGANDSAEYIVCNLPTMRESGYLTDWNIFFDKKTGKFYGMRIQKYVPSGKVVKYNFVLKSNNGGQIDEFGQYFLVQGVISPSPGKTVDELASDFPKQYYQYRIFSDTNNDGSVDNLVSTNCRVPSAVTITVDKGNLKDGFGNNYCYKSKSGTWGVVSTIALFGASAFAKTGAGMAASAVVSCGIMGIEMTNFWGLTRSNWPGG